MRPKDAARMVRSPIGEAFRRLPMAPAPACRPSPTPRRTMVGEGGVEPPRPYGHTDLNRARLPFRHSPKSPLTLARKNPPDRPGYDHQPLGKGRFVGVLQRFERRLGGMVEGAFAKVFKGDVQPVEVAVALQRETDDRKTVVGQGKVLVPNDFVVELGDHDFERLNPWAQQLGDELAAMVKEHAAEQSYTFVGPVKVALELMGDVDAGTFRVRSGVLAGDVMEGGRHTLASQAASDRAAAGDAPANALPGRPRLVLATGGKAAQGSPESRGEEQVLHLTHSVTVIGRAAEADLRLNDPGVSRKHAEIRLENGEFTLVDTGSTNGIRLNNAPVARQQLAPGDRIELGSTTLVFQRDGD